MVAGRCGDARISAVISLRERSIQDVAASLRSRYQPIAAAISLPTVGWKSRTSLAMASFVHESSNVISCKRLDLTAIELSIAPIKLVGPCCLPPFVELGRFDASLQSIRQNFTITLG
jgi:hypothetical protein